MKPLTVASFMFILMGSISSAPVLGQGGHGGGGLGYHGGGNHGGVAIMAGAITATMVAAMGMVMVVATTIRILAFILVRHSILTLITIIPTKRLIIIRQP